jgi:organic hydroperoxide reductase OsmC/OhrA
VPEVRARVFEFAVSADADGTVHSDRGGSAMTRDHAWSPEHLVLAGLVRCTLTSLEHHAKRSGVTITARGDAHGSVTRREEDGRFAFVSIDVVFDVTVDPPLERADVQALLERAERDCFIGASLNATPRHVWKVDGEEL